jgi:predicted small secreted protein
MGLRQDDRAAASAALQGEDGMNTIKGLVLALAVMGLSACNTISGAGQDIEAGGEAISDTAKKVQSDM